MVLSIAAVLQGLNPRLEESARILGAGRIATFLLVTFPLTLDGVATGTILVFMLTTGSALRDPPVGWRIVPDAAGLIYQQFNLTHDLGSLRS